MIKPTLVTEIALTSTETVIAPSTELIASPTDRCVGTLPAQEVKAVKKEYSIVGDAFYAGINSDAAPAWLTNLIGSTVDNSVANSLTEYDLLVQDVRNAIDSINVAANTYVEEIGFTQRVDGVVGTHVETLNATYDGKYATIANLDIVSATTTEAVALSAADLQAEFSEEINSRITQVEYAYASADKANADSITALTTVFKDQENNLEGTANAVSGLQTFVGVDESSSNPNGLGMLSRIKLLEKQSDGVVEFLTNTYDVMLGVEDPNNDTSNDQLIVDALPYVQWTNIAGLGVPTSNTRAYMNYALPTPTTAYVATLDGTFYVRSDYTNVDVDRYYKFANNIWTAVTEADYLTSKEHIREAHTGDVYIKYNNVAGAREYVRSYKFIKTEADSSSPYSTDAEGYGWALVTDTDSQSIYTIALQAKDAADGKISQFYAWGDMEDGGAPASYNITIKGVVETVSAADVVLWYTGGTLYRKDKGTSWGTKVPVPTLPGNGSFVSEGDLLTVFDPTKGDTATYWYSNGSWAINGPSGIVSKSKWFVDLDNAVTGPTGHVATSLAALEVTSKAYADTSSAGVENKFSYNSILTLNGRQYQAGFGLESSGMASVGYYNGNPVFDSVFRVNAERFILTNPAHPGVEASFNVTENGLKLSLDQTEATKNEPKGEHDRSMSYNKGDMVLSGGSSYIAKSGVPSGVLITNTSYWMVLTEKGETGLSSSEVPLYRRTTTATAPARPTAGSAQYSFKNGLTSETVNNGWETAPVTGTSGRYLWRITATASSKEPSTTINYYEFGVPSLVAESGTSGADGSAGSGIYIYKTPITSSMVNGLPDGNPDGSTRNSHSNYFRNIAGRLPQNKDVLSYVNDTASDPSKRFRIDFLFNGAGWDSFVSVIDGSQIIQGSLAVTGDAIVGGTISGTTIDIGSGTFKVSSSGVVTATAGSIGGASISNGTLQVESAHIKNAAVNTLQIAGNAITAAAFVSIPTFSVAKKSSATRLSPVTAITNNSETAYFIATIATRSRRTSGGSGSNNVTLTVKAKTSGGSTIAWDSMSLDSSYSEGTDFGHTFILYGNTTSSMYIEFSVSTGGESWQFEVTGGSIQSARR